MQLLSIIKGFQISGNIQSTVLLEENEETFLQHMNRINTIIRIMILMRKQAVKHLLCTHSKRISASEVGRYWGISWIKSDKKQS